LVDLSGRADYDRFSIQFKCHKKGKKMVEWGDIVGLADSHEGRIRYVTPILAWYVDLLDGRFVAIDAKAVTCDTTGFES
jgi:hypothetical protein